MYMIWLFSLVVTTIINLPHYILSYNPENILQIRQLISLVDNTEIKIIKSASILQHKKLITGFVFLIDWLDLTFFFTLIVIYRYQNAPATPSSPPSNYYCYYIMNIHEQYSVLISPEWNFRSTIIVYRVPVGILLS